ncbi:unnamed protein product [Allacma fusca]|uniref:Uncharacterized protein n=1 Tax=Allacma fusca TaxID=39272 RepID=A0A8J2KVJ8_9HEXA|nr:unnamed protein product [Allacma fusca]
MFSSKLLIIITIGITVLLACHFSQSFKIHETGGSPADAQNVNEAPATQIELTPKKPLPFPAVLSVRNPKQSIRKEDGPCEPCDGFTEYQCSVVCDYYELPYSKCHGCMCLCENNDWDS